MKTFWKYFFLLLSTSATAQNLVPNPSFEDTVACPTGLNQVYNASGWNNFGNTPDYFNTCAPYPVDVPNSTIFYQFPNSGNAFCGIVCYTSNTSAYNEFVGAQLITPLTIGQKYFISFYLSFSGFSSYSVATKKIGVLFSTLAYSETMPAPINNFAHFYSDSIVTDSSSWVFIEGSFIADSAYQYIIIGKFFDVNPLDTIQVSHINAKSYYLLDDICVSTDSLTCIFSSGEGINELIQTDGILIYPNPANDFITIDASRAQVNSVCIFNSMGEKIMNDLPLDIKKRVVVDITPFAKGIYFIKIKKEDRFIIKKLIKQ